MALISGTKLGQYEIVRLIGAGGMGEVYQASDTKLGRTVAIKILPQQFSHDLDRMTRFQREAQVLAAMNHPNIAQIYGLEESSRTPCIVMEMVHGESLQERLKRGPVPVHEALRYAEQICMALRAAHERGVVHRDLKPANVRVTAEGTVKILDFGLAKAAESGIGCANLSNSPTVSIVATNAGIILGTAPYMAPEQAKGLAVDARVDIWAFGCVLFEMLTAKMAFAGDSVAEILAAVLKGEPDWAALPAETPPSLRSVLRRCLQKDSNRRFHSAADVQFQIEEATALVSANNAPTAEARTSKRMRVLVAFGAVAIALAIVTAVALRNSVAGSAPQKPTRFAIALPPGQELVLPAPIGSGCPTFSLSPDGGALAFVATRGGGGQQRLYLRLMDDLEARAVPGSDGAQVRSPAFSEDGSSLMFSVDGVLKRIPTAGGPAVRIGYWQGCPDGSAWSRTDDLIIARGGDLLRLRSGESSMEPVLTSDLNKPERRNAPEFLPGDKVLLFTSLNARAASAFNWEEAVIIVRKLDSGDQRVLVQGGISPHYAPTGHLVFARSGAIMAVPFHLNRLEVSGVPTPIVDGLAQTPDSFSQFGISRNGTLAYIAGGAQQDSARTLVWVDRKGTVQPLGAPARAYAQPHLSPDGRQLAVAVESPKNDVWLYDMMRATLTRLTFEGGNNSRPVWTPDGKRILFRSDRLGAGNTLFWKLADGSGPEEQIATASMNLPSSISPDGKLAFYYATSPKTGRDIWMVPLLDDRKPTLLLSGAYHEVAPKISPDGALLAYQSNESGRNEIYVRSFPSLSGKWQISTNGGTEPLWARNGRELFYRSGDNMMSVEITSTPSFKAGTPALLFTGKYATRPGVSETNYEISPDGQRFLMIKPTDQPDTAPQINVVLNWFTELQQRVPVK